MRIDGGFGQLQQACPFWFRWGWQYLETGDISTRLDNGRCESQSQASTVPGDDYRRPRQREKLRNGVGMARRVIPSVQKSRRHCWLSNDVTAGAILVDDLDQSGIRDGK